MATDEGFLERRLLRFLGRASGWTVLALVLTFYPCIGLVLPVGLGLPRLGLVYLNIFGVLFAMMFVLGWLVTQLKVAERNRLIEWTTNLRLLDSSEFEWLVGEMFRREGWFVEERGRSDGPDGNIDLELTRQGQRVIVQCKRWQSWVVSVDEIRGFVGTLTLEKLSPQSGIFVTLSKFSEQAEKEARKVGLELIDSGTLLARIEKVRRGESCPTCGAAMVLDHSVRGWWFRCVVDGCKGKRDLGNEPGRAVELMLKQA